MAEDPSLIATIVLAAPPSRPDADYHGRPVLATVLEMVRSWELAEPTTVVLAPMTEHVMDVVDLAHAAVVVDEDGGGRSSALSVGLDAVSRIFPEAAAALIVDGDVPGIPETTVPALARKLETSQAMAVAPTYRYVRGGPVLVARRLWERIIASDHDQRLEEMLAAHPEWTANVVISEPVPPRVA